MNDIRVIKKYPNRRLYDTEISRYITLDEVRQLVLDNVVFRVEDKRTGRDITRSILLQVIAEQEEDGDPIFTTELLTFLVKFYGDPMQSSVSRYLELSTRLFMEQHSSFNAQLRNLMGQAPYPLALLREISDKQRPIWRLIRREFLKSLGRTKRRREESQED
jgi:polyhydroxyalkanoate synthesis repressor PhaR